MANLRAAKAAAVSAYLTDEAPLVTITNGAKSYATCYYNISQGKLQTDQVEGGVGRGTNNNPGTYTASTNEYGYDSSNNVVGKNIKIIATDAGVAIGFDGDSATPVGGDDSGNDTPGG